MNNQRFQKAKLATLTLLIASIVLLQGGCAKRLVFATKTNLGLDVSGTSQVPDKVAFTYSRYEGAIVPRSENGEPYSVYGGIDADVRFFGDQTIHQIFATGNAAVIAATPVDTPVSPCPPETNRSSTKELFFVTDTSYGLKLSAGKQDLAPTLMMGIKRVEGAIIPVDTTESEVRSVFADLSINSVAESTNSDKPSPTPFLKNRGVRIVQGFATGRAAELRATDRSVKVALANAASPAAAAAAVKVNITQLEKVSQWIASGGSDAARVSGPSLSPNRVGWFLGIPQQH